jgi:predicted dehydrogenase
MIRAACIGTGGISGVHLGYLRSRDDVEIVALCDIKRENLERRRREFGGKGFKSFRAMLDAVAIDAVWLCTPPQVRMEPLVACAERGIPVMCEKPVERDPGRAEEIDRELKRLKAKVQIGYVFRSMPTVARFQAARADDRVHLVQSCYACNMSLSRTFPPWFYEKERSGGALIDQATHNIDLLRMLMGEAVEVRSLAANPVTPKGRGYTVEEVFALSFLFEGGAAGGHVHTWVGDTWRNEIVFFGEKRLYRLGLGSGTLTVEEGSETRTFRQEQGRMYEHENARFLEMVKSGKWAQNPCSYRDGLNTLKLTVACDRALQS